MFNFCIITLFLFLSVAVALSLNKDAHDFTKSECPLCHSTQNTNYEEGSVTRNCMTCHTNLFEEGYMHPVDIKAKKVRIPPDFPLSSTGMLTCNTCHDVHANAQTPYGEKSSFLRRLESGKAFCDICHINSLTTGSGHQMLFREAHFTSSYIVTDPSNDIDPMSRNCLSCHDGSVGSSVELKAGSWNHSRNFLKFDKGGKHPIGMDYDLVRLRSKKIALKERILVDKRIRFFDRKLGCGSCHNPFSGEKYKLVIPTAKEELCLSCHNA